MSLRREKEGGEHKDSGGLARKKEGRQKLYLGSPSWPTPGESSRQAFQFFLFVILYEYCTKPNLSKLVSTLSSFAFEVNCVGFIELLGSDLFDFQVCVSMHV